MGGTYVPNQYFIRISDFKSEKYRCAKVTKSEKLNFDKMEKEENYETKNSEEIYITKSSRQKANKAYSHDMI